MTAACMYVEHTSHRDDIFSLLADHGADFAACKGNRFTPMMLASCGRIKVGLNPSLDPKP
jgi:hypothetical protein